MFTHSRKLARSTIGVLSVAVSRHQMARQGASRVAPLHHNTLSRAQEITTFRATNNNGSNLRRVCADESFSLSSVFDPPKQISRINTHYCREPQLVMIEGYGIIQGEMDKSRLLTKYLNIPFATVQDPKREAVAPEPWAGIRDATVFGPMCPQTKEESNSLQTLMLGIPGPGFEYSERDCLNLNIFAPRCVEGVPVICYIHGGLTRGGIALPKNDATNIVQKSVARGRPVIVVTINYRLLPNSGLLESGSHARGEAEDNTNWGLYDQKIALEWVRKHIHNFGGNPNEITLMGHAGGRGDSTVTSSAPKSGYHMMTRPKSAAGSKEHRSTASSSRFLEDEHLFKRAIIHSEGRSPTAKSGKNEDKRLAASTETGSKAAVTAQEMQISLVSQLTPWAQNITVGLDRIDFEDADGGVGFSFMSDACLPHMSKDEKQIGFQVIDRWIDFAWGQEDKTIDAPMAPQQTTTDPLTELLTGAPEKDPVYESLYNEENCLNLNIYMPESATKNPDSRLPVMVFFHGGGLRTGGNGLSLYDLTNFVAESVSLGQELIAIVPNYRLNYFGFLASKEMRVDSGGQPFGNWGLEDQIMALKWIQENVEHFNGDKNNVTACGQSSGATSLGALMLNQRSWGLFQKAILQSSGVTSVPAGYVDKEGQLYFDHLCKVHRIPSDLTDQEKVDRLRKVPEKAMALELNKAEVQEFMPFIDGYWIKDDVRWTVSDPSMYDPKLRWILAGKCHDDATAFSDELGGPTLETFAKLRKRLCPPSDYAVFDRLYKVPKTDAEALALSVRIVNDGVIAYPILAHSLAFHGLRPNCQLSRYHFDRTLAKVDAAVPELGAFHGVDLAYNFAPNVVLNSMSSQEKASVGQVQAIFIRFITAPLSLIPDEGSKGKKDDISKLVPTVTYVVPSNDSKHKKDKKEAIWFKRDFTVGRTVVETLTSEEMVFWRRSYAFAAEKAQEGHSTDYGFSMFDKLK
ncbi:hypothetical protein EMPS_01721 [Entomortierella parvispora]|uniref:Carboxylesterase type B domain-containing protein n=1 Tax=Entomortierella parvispora TaxID=205924 RepID=A0A9P3H3D0_9FUNG|nr:hypothetical protein EMPS_01721 [Entomortierella parvispora]